MRNSQADLRLDNLVGSSQRTPTKLSFWIMASRPRTLTISATPVIVGTALAWAAQGRVHWLAVLAALIGSMFIQIGTNIHNDAADFERGGDGPDRIGPARVTSSGLLSATTVKRGAYICFAIAALTGAYLVSVGGWPILLLGLLSIAAGWGYTGGPLPIAYTPLGELFCVIFFGLGGVVGTYFLSTRADQLSSNSGWAGDWFACGGGPVCEQPSRCRVRCTRGPANIADRCWARVDGRDLCRTDAASVCLAAADRPLLAAWTGMACTDRAATRTRDDLPICP